MVRKLFKHDMKRIWSMWWIALVVFLVISIGACACAVGYKNAEQALENSEGVLTEEQIAVLQAQVVFFVMVLGMATSVLALFSFSSMIFPAIHYYRSFYTDEGYLTFTLPVKVSSLYRSKLYSSYLIVVISLILRLGVALALGALTVPPESFSEELPYLFGVVGLYEFIPAEHWLLTVLNVAGKLVYELLFVATWQLAFNIGSLRMHKNRIILSVLLFFALLIAVSMAEGSLSLFLDAVNPWAALPLQKSAYLLAGLIRIVFRFSLFYVFHMISLHLLEKHLNLE